MLEVATSQVALQCIYDTFGEIRTETERLPAAQALGRILREDIHAPEDVPGFLRSSVDGYAVQAAGTFGCSDSIPALLTLKGQVEMGQPADFSILPGECAYVPTGGHLPEGADGMVMIEDTEAYGADLIGILKAAAPGGHCIFRGDDVHEGQVVLPCGSRIKAHDIGSLCAMGITEVAVAKAPIVGVLSTGDELIPPHEAPKIGQMRDVNGPLFCAAIVQAGGIPRSYGICKDDPQALMETLRQMAEECDMLLLSGGTSVGMRDATAGSIETLGRLLLHGIAIKPGKPTILGEVMGKPVFGMPGHPAAAYFIFQLFVRPLILQLLGAEKEPLPTCHAALTQAIPSNHGREECVAIALKKEPNGYLATPIMGKSGLITLLSNADGYIRIPRDAEGFSKDQQVEVILL